MSTRPCSSCARQLPAAAFSSNGGGKLRSTCMPCTNDLQREKARPLPPVPRDPVQIRINNVASTWHGPVRRTQLLRYAA